jgi:hypothetical protein
MMVIESPCDDCEDGSVDCEGECSRCGPRRRRFSRISFEITEEDLISAIRKATLLGEYGFLQTLTEDDAERVAAAIVAFVKQRDAGSI